MSSSPQLFWHQTPVSWKTIFPWTGVGAGRENGFKCLSFIVHFISNLMLLLILIGGTGLWPRGWAPILENIWVGSSLFYLSEFLPDSEVDSNDPGLVIYINLLEVETSLCQPRSI